MNELHKSSQHAHTQLHLIFLPWLSPLISSYTTYILSNVTVNTHTYVCIHTTDMCTHIFVNLLNFVIMNELFLLRLTMINEIGYQNFCWSINWLFLNKLHPRDEKCSSNSLMTELLGYCFHHGWMSPLTVIRV